MLTKTWTQGQGQDQDHNFVLKDNQGPRIKAKDNIPAVYLDQIDRRTVSNASIVYQ